MGSVLSSCRERRPKCDLALENKNKDRGKLEHSFTEGNLSSHPDSAAKNILYNSHIDNLSSLVDLQTGDFKKCPYLSRHVEASYLNYDLKQPGTGAINSLYKSRYLAEIHLSYPSAIRLEICGIYLNKNNFGLLRFDFSLTINLLIYNNMKSA